MLRCRELSIIGARYPKHTALEIGKNKYNQQYEYRENIKDDLYNHCSDITMCSIVHVFYGLINCGKAAYIKIVKRRGGANLS